MPPEPARYETLLPGEAAPPWGEEWARWHEALGLFADCFHQAAREAILARFPRDAPFDALDRLGQERGGVVRVDVLSRESDEAYRLRLAGSFMALGRRGSKPALQAIVNLIGLENAVVHDRRTWPVKQRRDIVIYVRQPHPWRRPVKIGSGWKVGDGTLVGIDGMSIRQRDALRTLLLPWIPGHCRCFMRIKISGQLIGGGWTVGDGTKVGGSSATIRIKG
jgi:hypothetical protein